MKSLSSASHAAAPTRTAAAGAATTHAGRTCSAAGRSASKYGRRRHALLARLVAGAVGQASPFLALFFPFALAGFLPQVSRRRILGSGLKSRRRAAQGVARQGEIERARCCSIVPARARLRPSGVCACQQTQREDYQSWFHGRYRIAAIIGAGGNDAMSWPHPIVSDCFRRYPHRGRRPGCALHLRHETTAAARACRR